MELSPAERVKLNAAILRSVKTGQPLSSNLQTLYDRAAQVESVKQTQPKALLSPGFPTRNITEVFVDPVTGRSDGYKHSGPASSLPTEDFNELYPKSVPVPSRTRFSNSVTGEERVQIPFQREFDFTTDPGANWINQDRVSVQDRSKRFLQNYFGGDPGSVLNPATGRFYGDELKIHDAMHDFANVGNTLRGEELITIAEQAGASPLESKNIGLENLTQQFLIGNQYSPAEITDEAMSNLRNSTRMGGRTLIQRRGAKQGSSLFRDANYIGSFLTPPISKEEFGTMVDRGREFYDQVHNNYANFKRFQTAGNTDLLNDEATLKDLENQFFDKTYGPSRAITQGIIGGYGESNSIPFGNYLSLMNAPLVPSVDEGLWNQSIKKQLTSLAPTVEAAVKTEQDFYNSPEQVEIRKAPEKWLDRSNLLREANDAQMRLWFTGEKVDDDYERYLKRLSERNPSLAESVNTPEFQRDLQVFSALENINPGGSNNNIAETIGPRPQLDYNALREQQKLTRALSSLDWTGLGRTNDALQSGIDVTRNKLTGGITGAGPTKEGRVYLNPANLGANDLNIDKTVPFSQLPDSSVLFGPSGRTPNDVLLQAAAEAKQIEGYNKALPGIKQAIRTGVSATADLAGAVPLFDPEFRQAVEQGDVRKAATQVAKEYVTGLVAAPVVGAGLGVAQRLAPQTAAAVIPAAATALRVTNPVAVVSQLGGDSPQPRAVGTYRGATVYRNPQGAFVAAPLGGKPMRLGQATQGGKPTFVPWGSVAGTKVGPRTVGRPWWDVGQFFGR
jgi:hypothetical protein